MSVLSPQMIRQESLRWTNLIDVSWHILSCYSAELTNTYRIDYKQSILNQLIC